MTADTLLDDDGRARAELGSKAALHAVHTTYRIAVEGAIADLAASGLEFDVETVRDRVGPPPGHANALGGAFQAAARRGVIRCTGYRPAGRPDAHRRVLRVWQGVAS